MENKLTIMYFFEIIYLEELKNGYVMESKSNKEEKSTR